MWENLSGAFIHLASLLAVVGGRRGTRGRDGVASAHHGGHRQQVVRRVLKFARSCLQGDPSGFSLDVAKIKT